MQGDKSVDLRAYSAIANIDRLRVPLLIVHGDKDQVVPPKQPSLYVDALKTAGKTYESVVLPGEGHGLSSKVNARTWYDRLDSFLAKCDPAT